MKASNAWYTFHMSSGGHGTIVDGIQHILHGQGVHITYKEPLYFFIALNVAFLIIAPGQTLSNYRMVLLLSPFWLSYALVYFGIVRWLSSRRIEWLSNQEYVLLEIRIPRDIRKTPYAMETVLSALHLSPGESTWWKKHVEGRVRPWWSLEIVSLGGQVHFYVWTRTGFRRAVESHFYAQYPGVEIVEAVDYTRAVDPSHTPYEMWGCDYKYTKDEDALPIRTYQDFMSPDSTLLKPEEQIDPLSQVLEALGSIGPKEQFWLQIIFRVHKGEKFREKDASYSIGKQAQEQLNEFRKSTVRTTTVVDPATGATREAETFPNPSRGVQMAMEAVERKVSKPLYDVGMRGIYLAPGESFHGPMIAQLIGLFKPFASEVLNSISITRWLANFDDQPWQDRGGHHRAHLRHELVDAYRRRAYFHEPYRLPYIVMSSEEIASIYHIPSSGTTTPSIPRIGSKTTEAPSNLPT